MIRGRIAGSPPPYPLRFVRCMFIAGRLQRLYPWSARDELRLPTLRVLFGLFLFMCVNTFIISPRWNSNTHCLLWQHSMTTTTISLDHRVIHPWYCCAPAVFRVVLTKPFACCIFPLFGIPSHSPPPPSHYVSCLFRLFSREGPIPFFPRRLMSNCAYRRLCALGS